MIKIKKYQAFLLIFCATFILSNDFLFTQLPTESFWQAQSKWDWAIDIINFKIAQQRYQDHLKELSEHYPAVNYYLQAARGIEINKDNFYQYSEGSTLIYGNKIYIDSLGTRYSSKESFQELEKEKRSQNILIFGASVAFGLSPYTNIAYSDIINRRQNIIRFYNYSRTGEGITGMRDSLLSPISVLKKNYSAFIISVESVNTLPKVCSRSYNINSVEKWKISLQEKKEALDSLTTYQGDDFALVMESFLKLLLKKNHPIYVLNTPLAYREDELKHPFYSFLADMGACSTQYQWGIVNIQNKRLKKLLVKYPQVKLIDLLPSMNGQKKYFWDSAHYSLSGHEWVADKILKAINNKI